MINIPFDQYQRYKNAQEIIEAIRKKNEKFRILEVGANEHKNLEKFLPNDEITYLDIDLPEHLLNDKQYIKGDATNMDFKENEYDIVVALDVYEHIPAERRQNFVNEVYRVSSKISIIGAPFNTDKVAEYEERGNYYFKSITGQNHRWLKEHIDNKLPDIEEFRGYLEENNINYETFGHGDLEVWEKLTNMHFVCVRYNFLIDYKQEIDNYYNQYIFKHDYSQNAYRNFFVLNKEYKFIFNKTTDFNSSKVIFELEKYFFNILSINQYQEQEVIQSNIRSEIQQLQESINDKKLTSVQVYANYGDGFKEENSIIKKVNLLIQNDIVFSELQSKPCSVIRIDPGEKFGNFKIENIRIVDINNNEISIENIESNAKLIDNNIYIFDSNDPQVVIYIKESYILSIEFNLQIVDVNTSALQKVTEQLNNFNYITKDIIEEKERYKVELEKCNEIIFKLKSIVNDKDVHINNLENIIKTNGEILIKLESDIKDNKIEIEKLNLIMEDRNSTIDSLNSSIEDRNSSINNLNKSIFDKETHINNLSNQIIELQSQIEEKNTKINYLEKQLSYKIKKFFKRFIKKS